MIKTILDNDKFAGWIIDVENMIYKRHDWISFQPLFLIDNQIKIYSGTVFFVGENKFDVIIDADKQLENLCEGKEDQKIVMEFYDKYIDAMIERHLLTGKNESD